tara:strand:+ start:597 stop:848 length:252 start_codon:yes stop_codon:yes gene_type:complete
MKNNIFKTKNEIFIYAQSLDVPTNGKLKDGLITFKVSDLIKGVNVYTKRKVKNSLRLCSKNILEKNHSGVEIYFLIQNQINNL